MFLASNPASERGGKLEFGGFGFLRREKERRIKSRERITVPSRPLRELEMVAGRMKRPHKDEVRCLLSAAGGPQTRGKIKRNASNSCSVY